MTFSPMTHILALLTGILAVYGVERVGAKTQEDPPKEAFICPCGMDIVWHYEVGELVLMAGKAMGD